MKRLEPRPRFQEVTKTFERQGFGQFFKGARKTSESLKETPEKRLKKTLEKLGGGFLLAGLFLAHRVDLIPPSYCKELNKLTDKGIAANFSEIERTIIKDYSRPVNTVFNEMWAKPIEINAVTQIHKARLSNGRIVFVKVIKESAIKLVEEDIIIAKYLAEQSDNKEIKNIIKEFIENFSKKKTLKAEKTFLKNSAQAYGSNYLPTLEEHLCGNKVIVFTYQKNKAKTQNKYPNFEKDIRTIKGELLILIIGVLILLTNIAIRGTINNILGLIGIAMIIISLLISIKSKVRK